MKIVVFSSNVALLLLATQVHGAARAPCPPGGEGSNSKGNGASNADPKLKVKNGGVNLHPYESALRDYLVEKHNWARGNLVPTEAANMRELTWDETLAIEASELAETCRFEHDTENYAYGQNLMYGGDTLDRAAVDRWIQEWVAKEISPKDRKGKGKMTLNHASAVLWANSHLIGCASNKCQDGYLTVCNYFQPGNWDGERTYEEGPSCSKCPPQAPYCDVTGKLCSSQASTNATTPAPSTESPSSEPTATPVPETRKPRRTRAPRTPRPTRRRPRRTPAPTPCAPSYEPSGTPAPSNQTHTPVPSESTSPSQAPSSVPTQQPSPSPVPTESPTSAPVPTKSPTSAPSTAPEPTPENPYKPYHPSHFPSPSPQVTKPSTVPTTTPSAQPTPTPAETHSNPYRPTLSPPSPTLAPQPHNGNNRGQSTPAPSPKPSSAAPTPKPTPATTHSTPVPNDGRYGDIVIPIYGDPDMLPVPTPRGSSQPTPAPTTPHATPVPNDGRYSDVVIPIYGDPDFLPVPTRSRSDSSPHTESRSSC